MLKVYLKVFILDVLVGDLDSTDKHHPDRQSIMCHDLHRWEYTLFGSLDVVKTLQKPSGVFLWNTPVIFGTVAIMMKICSFWTTALLSNLAMGDVFQHSIPDIIQNNDFYKAVFPPLWRSVLFLSCYWDQWCDIFTQVSGTFSMVAGWSSNMKADYQEHHSSNLL